MTIVDNNIETVSYIVVKFDWMRTQNMSIEINSDCRNMNKVFSRAVGYLNDVCIYIFVFKPIFINRVQRCFYNLLPWCPHA